MALQREKCIKSRTLFGWTLLFVLIVWMIFHYGSEQKSLERGEMLIEVQLRNNSSGSYWFELDTNGWLTAFTGAERDFGYTNREGIYVMREESVLLTRRQFEPLNALVEGITEEPEAYGWGITGNVWRAKVKKEDIEYSFTYGWATDERFDEIVEKLIEYSPFEIKGYEGQKPFKVPRQE